MNIFLGNLTIDDMERRTGVSFPEELREFMEPRHQAKAEDIKPGHWHCFDAPFMLICGDMETAKEIYKHLSPLSENFEEQLGISLNDKGDAA